MQALPQLTVGAVEAGGVVVEHGGVRQTVRIADCLRRELLDFAADTGRRASPLFATSGGAPLGRTNVSGGIRRLCAEARVPEEKGNPRCLRRLYQATRAGIEANVSLLVEQTQERLMEIEQVSIGWEVNSSEWRRDGSAVGCDYLHRADVERNEIKKYSGFDF